MLANATVFYMEPTTEEWPTTNGQFVDGLYGSAQCEPVNPDRLLGRGNFSHNVEKTYKYVTPNSEFFERLYPLGSWANNITDCIPNCIPATWRSDYARGLLLENNTVLHRVHMVPLFWQLISKGTTSNRGLGDCTHRSTQATMLMNYQWARTILNLRGGSQNSSLTKHWLLDTHSTMPSFSWIDESQVNARIEYERPYKFLKWMKT